MPIDMRGLDGVAIDRQPFVVALPRGHHLAAKQKLTVTDLDGEALVMYAPIESRHPHELVSFPFRVAGIKPNFVQYAREIHTMLALVGGGLGVALVPKAYEAAAHQLEAARLQRTHAGVAQTRRNPALRVSAEHSTPRFLQQRR